MAELMAEEPSSSDPSMAELSVAELLELAENPVAAEEAVTNTPLADVDLDEEAERDRFSPAWFDDASPPDLELAEFDLTELGLLETDLLETDLSDQALFLESDLEPPSLAEEPAVEMPKVWYLGIDFGTTGISAVLLNRLSCQVYPLYWYEVHDPAGDREDASPEKLFRLPTAVYVTMPDVADDNPIAPGDVAIAPLVTQGVTRTERQPSTPLLLRDFKPLLKVGIPHYSPDVAHWEPVLQWSDQQQVTLSAVQQALRMLLATLSYHPSEWQEGATLTCGAVGMETTTLEIALQQLAGVVVGYPVNWSDTYTFNVREAVLGAKLVTHPDQILFVEDAIATVLSGLRSADGRNIVLPASLAQKPNLHNADWEGGTLVINSGASLTELALVNLPDDLYQLSHQDFSIRSFAYAGNALDQDIICHLIYPAWMQQSRTADPWHEMGWSRVLLPVPGEVDAPKRHRLQQMLLASRFGQQLLDTARRLKIGLQQQDHLTVQFEQQPLVITRQDLGSRIFLPYIQRLNRELNQFLTQTEWSSLDINQVICTGGTASLGAIARWLRQKLPNATIIQDTYPHPRYHWHESCLPTCSRVAYGLATLVLHPQILDRPRQQYSDYFLLLELLRAFPDEPVSFEDVRLILEQRGINTQLCSLHILALLEGHLPPGLVPAEEDATLLSASSHQNLDYQVLQSAPLFTKQDQIYVPNFEQWTHLRRHLSSLMVSTHQKLTEPLSLRIIA